MLARRRVAEAVMCGSGRKQSEVSTATEPRLDLPIEVKALLDLIAEQVVNDALASIGKVRGGERTGGDPE